MSEKRIGGIYTDDTGYVSQVRPQVGYKDAQQVELDTKDNAKHRAATFSSCLEAALDCRAELKKYAKEAEIYGFPKELRNCFVSLGEFVSKIQLMALSFGHGSDSEL